MTPSVNGLGMDGEGMIWSAEFGHLCVCLSLHIHGVSNFMISLASMDSWMDGYTQNRKIDRKI